MKFLETVGGAIAGCLLLWAIAIGFLLHWIGSLVSAVGGCLSRAGNGFIDYVSEFVEDVE